jgi:hypothetical protein
MSKEPGQVAVARGELLDPATLRSMLRYEPDTGLFFWLQTRGRSAKAGDRAGRVDERGYYRIRVNGRLCPAHRVAFALMTGRWPIGEVDHIDGDPGNNRWPNLREATRSQQTQNTRLHSDSRSGLKGAYYDRRKYNKRWYSRIVVDGKAVRLGFFHTAEEAHDAYKAAAEKYFGEFARLA